LELKRRTLVIIVVAAVAASTLATWIANEKIRSPAEAAARTAVLGIANTTLLSVMERVGEVYGQPLEAG